MSKLNQNIVTYNQDETAELKALLEKIYSNFNPKIDTYQVENIKELVAQGANPNVTTDNKHKDQSLLSLTLMTNNFIIIKSILELPNIDLERTLDKEGNNILHFYCRMPVAEESVNHLNAIINNSDLKVELKLYLNSQNDTGHTPLYLAFHYGNLSGSFGLLLNDVRVEVDYKSGTNTLIHLASSMSTFGSIDKLPALIRTKKIDINALNGAGYTALHIACKEGTEKHIKYLLKGGAKQDIKDYTGNLAVHYAKDQEIIAMLAKDPNNSKEVFKLEIKNCVKQFVENNNLKNNADAIHEVFKQVEEEYTMTLSGDNQG